MVSLLKLKVENLTVIITITGIRYSSTIGITLYPTADNFVHVCHILSVILVYYILSDGAVFSALHGPDRAGPGLGHYGPY